MSEQVGKRISSWEPDEEGVYIQFKDGTSIFIYMEVDIKGHFYFGAKLIIEGETTDGRETRREIST